MVSRESRYQPGARRLLLFGAVLLLVHLTAHAAEPEPFQGPAPELGACPAEEPGFTAEPISFERCDSGGRGSRACEAGEGLKPMGVYDGCGISCQEGFYACCRRGTPFSNPTCFCIQSPTWPYTPAFRLHQAGWREQ
jgi:hypothetical protein